MCSHERKAPSQEAKTQPRGKDVTTISATATLGSLEAFRVDAQARSSLKCGEESIPKHQLKRDVGGNAIGSVILQDGSLGRRELSACRQEP